MMKNKSVKVTDFICFGLFLCAAFTFDAFATGAYEDGSGTEGDPYQIKTAYQLEELSHRSEDWDKCFILIDDIDMSDYTCFQSGSAAHCDQVSLMIGSYSNPFTGYVGWDFSDTWWIISGQSFPSLLSQTGFAGGYGTSENPWQISQPKHLMSIGSDPNLLDDHFILLNDIVFDPDNNSDHVFTEALIAPYEGDGIAWSERNLFTGVFDGEGHKIVNLYIDSQSESDVIGLFGYVNQSQIRDVGLENGFVCGNSSVGLLAGRISYSQVDNCYSSGTVTGGTAVGGLFGFCSRISLSNSYSTCLVSGSDNLGGLLGESIAGSISDCYATGSVTQLDDNQESTITPDSFGGLVGRNYSCDISRCYATGDVQGEICVGGLLGSSYDCLVSQSYATGSIIGERDVGGLVGLFYGRGDVLNCYAEASVSGGSCVGGLVGNNEVTVSNCYAVGDVNSDGLAGSLVGLNFYQDNIADGKVINCFCLLDFSYQPIGGGSGTVENCIIGNPVTMKFQIEYTKSPTAWDFVGESTNGEEDIWRLCVDRSDYPRLWWEFASYGDFVCGDGVGVEDFAYLSQRWFADGCGGLLDWQGGIVDLVELANLSENWLDGAGQDELQTLAANWLCSTPVNWYRADLNRDGKVDVHDLAEFSRNWLAFR